MGEFVGVKPVTDIMVSPSLKREALLFNRIATPSLNTCEGFIKHQFGQYSKPFIDEINWLIEQGILFDPSDPISEGTADKVKEDPRYAKLNEGLNAHQIKLEQAKEPLTAKLKAAWASGKSHYVCEQHEMDNYLGRLAEMNWYLARMAAIQLRIEDQIDAHPCTSKQIISEETAIETDGVIQITLNALPVPNTLTSWEHILEYRSDLDSHSKFLSLRNWMSEVARDNRSPIEIEQKLEYLMDQYRRHLELHKMKSHAGIVETLVVSSAELLEDLMKIKWGKIAKGLFSFRQKKIAMLEGELTSPGSEVAYIVKAQETFE